VKGPFYFAYFIFCVDSAIHLAQQRQNFLFVLALFAASDKIRIVKNPLKEISSHHHKFYF
jgi:hypothetical protein